MTEAELAERLGLSRPYVNAVSSGKKNVTVSQLERMAEALGMRLHIAFDDGVPWRINPTGFYMAQRQEVGALFLAHVADF